MLLNWERIAFRTVYTDAATPIPVGVPVLGFTSLAMHRAVQARWAATEAPPSAPPSSPPATGCCSTTTRPCAASSAADRAASLASVRPGPAKRLGVKVGKRAARGVLKERAGDGYLDPTIHYSMPPGARGVAAGAPGDDMLGAWIGSLRHLVVRKHVEVDGPDALTSSAYTAQFEEVKSLGRATSTTRTEAQRQTALFFNSNAATMLGDALVRYLERHPMSLPTRPASSRPSTPRMTDSLIQCWRLKRDVGFWRPSRRSGTPTTAIPRRPQDATWTPLIPNPPYSDYVSGHGCLTGPAVEVIRQTLGERTQL